MKALNTLLALGTIDLDNAVVQCLAAKQILASINPSFATEPCECLLGNSSSCAASILPPPHIPRLALYRHHA